MSKIVVPKKYDWPIAIEAVHLIAEKEQGPKGGPALVAYLCPAGKWTIGFGRIAGVVRGMTCTVAQAWEWLHEEIVERTEQVLALCKVLPTPNQLGALVSLQYNIGQAALWKSTVMQRHNEANFDAASRAFRLWNKITDPASGKKVEARGLTIRRAAEAALYLKPEPGDMVERMPQAVESETRLYKSPISISGAATAGGGALTAINTLTKADEPQIPTGAVPDLGVVKDNLGTVASTVQETKAVVVDTLGFSADWILPAVLIGAGVAVLVWRYRQRKQGWA